MVDNRYSVELHYDPEDAQIHQKVIACLTRLDPKAAGRFEKAGFTGRLILKRNTDMATARRMKQLLNKTGASCDIRELSVKSSAARTEDLKAAVPAAVDPAGPAPTMRCPKCGCEQPANPECRACGVIIARVGRDRPSPAVTAAKPSSEPPHQLSNRFRQRIRPILTLIHRIQHPIDLRKLTTWSRRVADRLIRCGMVLAVALILEIGLLYLGKMLWSLYVATAAGQYYVDSLSEEARVFQSITEADPLSLGLDITLVVFFVNLLVACASQILHLTRYLYESQGILGKLILWFIPYTGLSAWFISQRHPYPELALAGTLALVPTLCMLSSCLYLARIILPEVGDLRAVVSIIMNNKDAAWALIIKKIRIWFDATKRTC